MESMTDEVSVGVEMEVMGQSSRKEAWKSRSDDSSRLSRGVTRKATSFVSSSINPRRCVEIQQRVRRDQR